MRKLTTLMMLIGLNACSSIKKPSEINTFHPAHPEAEIAQMNAIAKAWSLEPLSFLNETTEDKNEMDKHKGHNMHNMEDKHKGHNMHNMEDKHKEHNMHDMPQDEE